MAEMTNQQKPTKTLNIVLWVVQILLATTLLWSVAMKLFQPIEELTALWPWAGQVPLALVKLTGAVDLLAALGLILPAALRIQPKLTPIAAVGVVVLMLCAIIFHVSRGEASVIGVNIVFGILATFVGWGRFRHTPIQPK